jgi:hypothetical protein
MRGSGDGQGELAEQGGQGKEGTKTKKAQNSDCPVHRKRRTTATNINSAALTLEYDDLRVILCHGSCPRPKKSLAGLQTRPRILW